MIHLLFSLAFALSPNLSAEPSQMPDPSKALPLLGAISDVKKLAAQG